MARSAEPLFGVHLAALRDAPLRDLAIRFAFGAAISAIAGVVSIVAGGRPGGLLLAFPAILPATLTLVEKDEGERQAEDLDVGAIFGAAALGAFAVVVWQYMPAGTPGVVLVLALLAWLGTSVGLYLGFRLTVVGSGSLHRGVAELARGRRRSSPRPESRRAGSSAGAAARPSTGGIGRQALPSRRADRRR